jgi:hypothetical protein
LGESAGSLCRNGLTTPAATRPRQNTIKLPQSGLFLFLRVRPIMGWDVFYLEPQERESLIPQGRVMGVFHQNAVPSGAKGP